jgi:cytochrome P450
MVDLGFGSSMDGLAGNNEHDWIARFFLHGRFSTIRMCTCWFFPLDKILDTLFLALKRRQRAKNWALFSSKIDARLAKGDLGSERSDLVTPVFGKLTDKIEAGNNGNTKEKRITKGELLSHALACTLANSQLTTGGITTCMYLLLQNPMVMQELVGEIRRTFTREEQIGVTSTQSLVYLEAVLHETLRIHNPTPINLPRVIPPEGRVIEGTFIPGNTIVGINLHVIQTSPLYWFEPHVFHPERFLPQTDPRYDHRFDQDVKAAFMPFSTGPRNCIGAK